MPKPRRDWAFEAQAQAQKLTRTILWNDPANVIAAKHTTFIVWRCNNHATAKPLNPEATEYISPLDGKPAYRTRISNFLGATMCCGEANNSYQRDFSRRQFELLLSERSSLYNTQYTLYNVGPTGLIGGNKNPQPIHCSKHGTISNYSLNRLTYHTAMPCPMCRQDVTNYGKAPAKIVFRYKNKKGTAQARFRLSCLTMHGTKCALTGATFSNNNYLDCHHINGRDEFPHLASTMTGNSLVLLKAVHTNYHYSYLGRQDSCSYDSKARETATQNVNIISFREYLEQLQRDFTVHQYKESTLAFCLNVLLKRVWQKAYSKGETVDPLFEVTLDKIQRLLTELNQPIYTDLFLSQPEGKEFMAARQTP